MTPFDKLALFGVQNFNLKIAFKDESIFMKILGKLLFFNTSFMTTYITTIGSTVYFPSSKWLNENKDAAAATLAHELVHIYDSKISFKPWFSVGYLAPQLFAIFALFAIPFSIWNLLFLLWLLPIPSDSRTFLELRGYAMSDAVQLKTTGAFLEWNFIMKQFTSSAYYWMWPFKSSIMDDVSKNRALIWQNRLDEIIPISKDILKCFDA